MNIDKIMNALYASSTDDSYTSPMLSYEEMELILEALQTYLVAVSYEEDIDEVEQVSKLIKKILYFISMYKKTDLN